VKNVFETALFQPKQRSDRETFCCFRQSRSLDSCLRAKPAAGAETLTCADTGCDWQKQLKHSTAVLAL